ncbi:MAG TPA: ribosome biogenesis GTPase Der, partial [Longimicrobiales bacterium]|nr:ribosome biogenesis GTPase Der [Longimicrobiales bacterium]
MSRLPVVAVVGRPNVGKSTFFNRVIGRRVAIVDDRPGVTRDRNFARAEWAGRPFFVVDTGGVIEGSDEPLDRAIRHQALAAVAEADVILMIVDGQQGVHPLDEKLADVLRKAGRPVLLVVNKMDNLPDDPGHHAFWELGLGEPVPVSAISGKGSGDLLDRIVQALPEAAEPAEEDEIRVAVIGKPNVGKSSFVNRIFGEERVVVSDVAGPTRDPVDTPLRYHGRTLVFVDTAGLRRQSKVSDALEYYSALRTERVVRDADVCVLLVDAVEGELHHQDVRIAEQAQDAGAGLIVVVNKWDLVEKDTLTAPHFEKRARERYPFLAWVPFVFASALTGQRVRRTLDLIVEVHEERRRRIDT